jgi:hypothetical protein
VGECGFIIQFLSSIDIFDVADDSGLGVRGERLEEPGVAAHLLENDQAFALLALIVGLLHVFAFEQEPNQKLEVVLRVGWALVRNAPDKAPV